MATKTLPYFQWYPSDAESDDKYSSMTDEELGFFHRCLNKSWINHGIPADPDERARMISRSRDVADRLWQWAGKGWVPHPSDSSKIVHPRQELEREKAKSASDKRSEAGKAGGYASVQSKRQIQANVEKIQANVDLESSNRQPRAYESESKSVFENLGSKTNPEIKGGAGGIAGEPTGLEELEYAWERHHKHARGEPKDLAFSRIVGMGDRFDVARFRTRHEKFCNYWNDRDWSYCPLSFLGWVEAGMPEPPPEAKAGSVKAKTKSQELREYLESEAV